MKVAVIFLLFGVSFCSAKIKSHRKDIKNQSKTGGENFLNHVLVPNQKKLEFGILFLLIIGYGKSTSIKQATALDFNKEAVEAVVNANNNFGNVLFKILAKHEQNLIMSSFSVSTVLNMILNGAEGSTASQLKQGLTLKDFDVVKNGFKDALKLMKTNENFTLSAANRYVNNGLSNQSYWTQMALVLLIVWTSYFP